MPIGTLRRTVDTVAGRALTQVVGFQVNLFVTGITIRVAPARMGRCQHGGVPFRTGRRYGIPVVVIAIVVIVDRVVVGLVIVIVVCAGAKKQYNKKQQQQTTSLAVHTTKDHGFALRGLGSIVPLDGSHCT